MAPWTFLKNMVNAEKFFNQKGDEKDQKKEEKPKEEKPKEDKKAATKDEKKPETKK